MNDYTHACWVENLESIFLKDENKRKISED